MGMIELELRYPKNQDLRLRQKPYIYIKMHAVLIKNLCILILLLKIRQSVSWIKDWADFDQILRILLMLNFILISPLL